MKAVYVISNNAVVVRDGYGKDYIVTGKGIGFRKKKGDRINLKAIINVYIEDSRFKERLLKQTTE